jgi:hypothetical protein
MPLHSIPYATAAAFLCYTGADASSAQTAAEALQLRQWRMPLVSMAAKPWVPTPSADNLLKLLYLHLTHAATTLCIQIVSG